MRYIGKKCVVELEGSSEIPEDQPHFLLHPPAMPLRPSL